MSTSSVGLSRLERKRIVPLQEASRLMGASVDTIMRRHPDKVIDISPRRKGMRVEDALLLPPEPPEQSA